MIADTQDTDFGPRAKIDLCLKQVWRMRKSLMTISTQRTDFGLMVVSQRMVMLRVVA